MATYQHLIGRHRMRCSRSSKRGCGRRFTIKRNPEDYRRWPKCPHCGCWDTQSVEASRRAEAEREDTCHCSRYPFPHRAGSLRMCIQHPLEIEGVEPTAEEWRDYEATVSTPRGQDALTWPIGWMPPKKAAGGSR